MLSPMLGRAQGTKGKTSPPRPGGGIQIQAPGTQRMGFRSGTSGVFLLRDPKVQKELGVTAAQKTKIDAVMKTMPGRGGPGDQGAQGGNERRRQGTPTAKPGGDMMSQMQKSEKALNALLTASQKSRLKQLQCQRSGPMILMSDDYAKQIGLTSTQKQQITKNLQSFWQKNMPKPGSNPGTQRMDRTKMEKLRDDSNNQILKVLTTAQKQKWAAMKGKPFTFSERSR